MRQLSCLILAYCDMVLVLCDERTMAFEVERRSKIRKSQRLCFNDHPMKSSKLVVQKNSSQRSGNEEILISAHLPKEHPKENFYKIFSDYNQRKDAENNNHQESRSLVSNSSVDLAFESGYILLYDDTYLKNNSQVAEKYETEIKKAIDNASLSNSNCTTKTERISIFISRL
ncbi:hypothetical protein T07_7063 [Trichinella nelsoni]|uniref:Uncharacterized protein n=1 Tax=Trichinella nelsoni TaxID=6336 RepID=A0A0V0RI00_9BILA|nr:hypothetical protein T07_7063 [Trichinella nelsoni]